MSYDAREASRNAGRPFFLYEFARGVSIDRLTSRSKPYTATIGVFAPSAIAHGDITTGGNATRESVEIRLPYSDPVAAKFLGAAAPQRASVTIWRGHEGEAESELRVIFKGTVKSARPERSEVTIVCAGVLASLRNAGLTERVTRTCRHALYSQACGVNKAAHEVAGTVTAVAGLKLTIAEAALQPAGYYTGGIVDLNGALGFIIKHVGAEITTRAQIAGMAASAAVKIYPGCALTTSVCESKFANLNNFGGFPFIPSTNPFNGSSVI